ncbi:MAG: ATP-binding cassette domain-containing protein, partial [Acidimicrobiia bacterium]
GIETSMAGANVIRQIAATRRETRLTHASTAEAMELVGISELAGQQAGLLSTGQRRLVELARCLAGNFDVLLLDEPSSGLDNNETAQFGAVLRKVVAQRACGILLVEHDMSLVMDICEHIYVLDFGDLVFQGSPREVASSPIVQAAYLGSSELDPSLTGSEQ